MENRGVTLVFGVLLICIVVFSGCTQPPTGQAIQQTASQPTTPSLPSCNAESIETFFYADEGELIRFYFLLQDSAGANTVCGGQANFSIVDDRENEVYSSNFSVNTKEFVEYQFQLTAVGIGKAYEWRIKKSDIKKGYSQWGKAKIELSTKPKTLKSEAAFLEIPVYSEEEIKRMEEESFSKVATTINQTISKGNFSVTVIRAGSISKYDYSGEKEYLRIDMKVKNTGSTKEYFAPSGMAIISGNNQYEASFGGTLNTFSEIYPSIEKEGYALFEMPKTVKDMKLVFELGWDSEFNRYQYTYQISLE